MERSVEKSFLKSDGKCFSFVINIKTVKVEEMETFLEVKIPLRCWREWVMAEKL